MRPVRAFLPCAGAEAFRGRRGAHAARWTCSATDGSVAFVLSHFEARDLLPLREHARAGAAFEATGGFSVDIGKRRLESVRVLADGIAAPGADARVAATWEELRKMCKKGRAGAYECFNDGETQARKIAGLSEETGRAVSLLPVARGKPPTVVIGGFGMHRMRGTEPWADTEAKIRAVGAGCLRGDVLDVCTGLGYTAVAAARAAAVRRVVTVERDAMVVEVGRRNPWSEEVFAGGKIERVVGDAVEVVRAMETGRFDVVVHDPPAMGLGGELYSGAMYAELRRVCRKGARLFHYVGDPASKESGRLYRGVQARLRAAGWNGLEVDAVAYGVSAWAE